VPLTAAGLADLLTRDLHPLEVGGTGEHRRQQLALASLRLGAFAQRHAGGSDLVRERVAGALELTEIEDPRVAGRSGDLVLDDDPPEALGDETGELAVELGDLRAQLGAGGALRDRCVQRRELVSYEQPLHTPRIESRSSTQSRKQGFVKRGRAYLGIACGEGSGDPPHGPSRGFRLAHESALVSA